MQQAVGLRRFITQANIFLFSFKYTFRSLKGKNKKRSGGSKLFLYLIVFKPLNKRRYTTTVLGRES
jgi:hypothetical protein